MVQVTNDFVITPDQDIFDPDRWGLPLEAVESLADDLYAYWERCRACFRTRTRDGSAHAYTYLRGQLTMEDRRTFANMGRRLAGDDGQGLQQFASDSPWAGSALFEQIQTDIGNRPALKRGGIVIADESADEKAGQHSIGASRQYNGRLGKIELSQVATCLTYAHPATGTWALVDAEVFLPQEWFTAAFAERRQALGIPEARVFATKPELCLQMITRVQAHGLPFELVACDDLYGRNRAFRAGVRALQVRYAAEIPATTQLYLQEPRTGIPRRRRAHGRRPTRAKVLSRQVAHEVRAVARRADTRWERVAVRATERGDLIADFAVRQVWTVTDMGEVQADWLVTRRADDGTLTYVLLNAPTDTPPAELIEQSCQRHFTERAFQDAKSELGWADFQAQKYRAWEHHMALTAAALWFIAEVKLNWRERYARDPELKRQFEVEVLPALSTANVRDMLMAVLPVPQFTPEEARHVVAQHLVNRSRSTRSRLFDQRNHEDST
jgi:SRSO17 transposase